MKAKDYLQQLEKLDIIIDQKIKERSELRSLVTGVSGVDPSAERVQGGSLPGDTGFAKTINKIVDLEKEIDSDIDAFIDKKDEIINKIHGLQTAKYIVLLYKKYVQYERFEQIAVEMGYTYQYVIELHGYALQEFEKTYENL